MLKKLISIKQLQEIEHLFKQSFSEDIKKEYLEKCLESRYISIFGYLEEKSIKGFLIYQSILGEGELIDIVVDKRDRNKGVGTTMLKELFLKFPEDTIYLEVFENNLNAIKLYKGLGFIEYRKVDKYYKNLGTAVFMKKEWR